MDGFWDVILPGLQTFNDTPESYQLSANDERRVNPHDFLSARCPAMGDETNETIAEEQEESLGSPGQEVPGLW